MPRRTHIARIAFAAVVLCCAPGGMTVAGGLDSESNTDGFDPGAEAYRVNEARRLNAMGRQLDLIYRMQWENPYFVGEGPIRQPIGYESKQVSPNRWTYRPIYAEDMAPAVGELPSPEALPVPLPQNAPTAKPEAPAPAGAAAEDFIPPRPVQKRPPVRGPREF